MIDYSANTARVEDSYRQVIEGSLGGFRLVVDHMYGLQERNVWYGQAVVEGMFAEMNRQAEANVEFAREFYGLSERRLGLLGDISDGYYEAWAKAFDTSVEEYRRNLELVEESVENAVEGTVEVVEKTVEAMQEVVSETQESIVATAFPVEGYDDMNVEQVRKNLDGLNAAQIRTVRDHEKRNKNRETLIELFDRKLRAESA